MLIEKELVRAKAGTSAMVTEIRIFHDQQWVPQNVVRSVRICEEIPRRIFPHSQIVHG